jgi:signal transduction histidine kinase
MELSRPCAVAPLLAARIRESRNELTERWLERIAARVDLDPERVFPTDQLLDHVPVLMVGVADYLEDPADEITADMPVVAKALELGELRFSQGFDAAEILKEYEILGGVLFSFSSRVLEEAAVGTTTADLLVCGHRLFRAISVIEQLTTSQYLRALAERVGEREDRLRRFSRMITHELKNRVGATLGAGQLLQEEWLGGEERRRFAAMVTENAQEIQKVLENLTVLSRIDRERRRERNIPLREVTREVFRQLRELAKARSVDLRMADDLPELEVNAAAVELCLSNYLSNAIKYSEPSAQQRWAKVDAELAASADGGRELVVRVTDNGIGVPKEGRHRLFERFYRAHEHRTGTEGTGLGLSLVQETAASLGGRAWADFPDQGGSVFAFALPCREADGVLSCGAPVDAYAGRPIPAGAERGKASDSQP